MFRIQLKKLREEAGESQYSFAKKFGVAQSTIGNWESGTREPNLDSISRLADYFGVTVDHLLGRPSAPPVQREEVPPLLASLIASFKELNAEGLRQDAPRGSFCRGRGEDQGGGRLAIPLPRPLYRSA